MKKLNFGVIANLLGDTVQDEDTHTWLVFKISKDEDVIVLISEEKDLRKTKLKVIDYKYFVDNFYQYRYHNNTEAIVLKKIIDIYD